MDEKPKKIIVKHVKKVHGGHHGGSWKVAYADFVTAMMAFFLVMWLLNMSSQEKRAVLAQYFKHFSLFEKGGQSFMHQGGTRPSGQNFWGEEIIESGEHASGITNDELATKLMTGVEQVATQTGKEQVMLALTDEGIRIQIVDTRENPIFAVGSAQLTDSAKKIVHSIGNVLKNFPNEIIVEGHSDASPVKSEQASNWDLSVARASSARRELEQGGISPSRIARVVGFSDKMPLYANSPADPRNRRISIVFCKNKKIKPPDKLDWLVKPPA
ncbi:MAG: OmpA family protein [Desulfobacteraceae bacterium]|nr:OmpA family protein [Desulfobacteraceae bacterium]